MVRRERLTLNDKRENQRPDILGEDTTKMVKSTIIIPTHNRPKRLKRALQSAIIGLPVDGEIVVVDDGSNVPAAHVLRDIEDRRVRVIRCEQSMGRGGSPARNMGMQVANGAVIFFLDDDDEMLPDYLHRTLSTGVWDGADFGFAARKFSRSCKSAGVFYEIEDRRIPSGVINARHSFRRRTFPFSSGFWIRRDAYDVIGPMSEMLQTNSDTDYSCRLYAAGARGWYSPEPAVIVHQLELGSVAHVNSVTQSTKSADRARAFELIAKRNFAFMKADVGASEFVHARWIKHALKAGMPSEARKALASVPQWKNRVKLTCLYAALRTQSLVLNRNR